jgi:spore coat protein U-like protein
VFTDNTVDSTGTISVACDANTSYTIAFSQGNSGSFTVRRMTNGGNILEYNLYTDATYQTVWGNGIAGSIIVSGSTSDTLPTNHTVYGRIPLNTQLAAVSGSYTDSIAITVTY